MYKIPGGFKTCINNRQEVYAHKNIICGEISRASKGVFWFIIFTTLHIETPEICYVNVTVRSYFWCPFLI